jgi:hypothetical protein
MGNEEHNPLAQYEDLTVIKQVEVVKRLVSPLLIARGARIADIIYKKISAKQAQYVGVTVLFQSWGTDLYTECGQ